MIRLALILLLFSSPVFAAESVTDELITGRATYIVDGDTLDVGEIRIRLWGINTPERGKAGYADAKEFLKNLTTNATLNCLAMYYDRWKRTVASCEIDGQDIGRIMVLSGMAIDHKKYSNGFYDKAEAQARINKVGFWADQ
jgi:endonuclease YncB( thermonuclease family)